MGKPGGGGDSGTGTTFVRTDSACFRDLVQRLTGPSGNPGPAAPPLKSPAPKPKPKLHERRRCNKPKIDIQSQPTSPPIVNAESPNGGYWAGPWSCPTSPFSSISLASPVGSSNKRASPSAMMHDDKDEEEEKAIKEKRFYLHPSPQSRPRLATEPELLSLFPLKSPTTTTS